MSKNEYTRPAMPHDNSMHLVVTLTDSLAQLPSKGSIGAAGYDLFSLETRTLAGRGGRGMFSTGLSFTVPLGTYGRIAPRSGLAVKAGIDVLAGVIDRDYTDTVRVVLINHGDEDHEVHVGDRIAQLILERIVEDAHVVEVQSLDTTIRGKGGFGSTGR